MEDSKTCENLKDESEELLEDDNKISEIEQSKISEKDEFKKLLEDGNDQLLLDAVEIYEKSQENSCKSAEKLNSKMPRSDKRKLKDEDITKKKKK